MLADLLPELDTPNIVGNGPAHWTPRCVQTVTIVHLHRTKQTRVVLFTGPHHRFTYWYVGGQTNWAVAECPFQFATW